MWGAPFARVTFWRPRVFPLGTLNRRVVPPPSRVTLPPPSTVVFCATIFSLVIAMVTGVAPQLNVTSPPPTSAVFNAPSVQLAADPVPTVPAAVAVRCETITAATSAAANTALRAAEMARLERHSHPSVARVGRVQQASPRIASAEVMP